MRHRLLLIITCFWVSALFGAGIEYGCFMCGPKNHFPCPWFTSPLLIPYRYVADYGNTYLQTFLFENIIYGKYDSHWHSHGEPNFYNANVELFYRYGFAPRFDYLVFPQVSWNYTQGVSRWTLNDTFLAFDYMLLIEDPCTWRPSIKVTANAALPTGKYQHLNPKKKKTDLGGMGNWAPGPATVISKQLQFGKHFFFPMLSVRYDFGIPVHVKGANAYGGGHGTKGTILPGNSLQMIFSYEFTIMHCWVLSTDCVYLHNDRSRFRGRTGGHKVGLPSSEQLSIAPAIEYNWSGLGGVIGGFWFTVAGRNAEAFASAAIAVYVGF